MGERRAIERLKGGDPGGLEHLVRTHQVRAVRTAYLICRDRPLAEDVVQNAFVKAYEKISGFDERRPFAPWFTKMVVNDAIKAASRRQRTVPYTDEDTDSVMRLVDPQRGPQELLEEAEERQRVWEALEKLPPAQRAVVVQRYYLGMTEAEMTEGGTSRPGTIKWRLHAARRSLSKFLRPQLRAQEPSATKGTSPGVATLDVREGGCKRD